MCDVLCVVCVCVYMRACRMRVSVYACVSYACVCVCMRACRVMCHVYVF